MDLGVETEVEGVVMAMASRVMDTMEVGAHWAAEAAVKAKVECQWPLAAERTRIQKVPLHLSPCPLRRSSPPLQSPFLQSKLNIWPHASPPLAMASMTAAGSNQPPGRAGLAHVLQPQSSSSERQDWRRRAASKQSALQTRGQQR